MLSRTVKSGNKYGAKRALSFLLSGVLAVTVMQAFPLAANANPGPVVDLVARADDNIGGESILLGETTLLNTDPTVTYRLDINPECGVLDHIGDIAVDGITDEFYWPINWSANPPDATFIGTPEKLKQVLDQLAIIRETGSFGYIDCPTSQVNAWLAEANPWSGNNRPPASASYQINNSNSIPSMYVPNASPSTSSPRLVRHSDGFEIEWNEYLGATGYTPAGYTLRYRDVTNGLVDDWIYSYITDGRNLSAVVGGLASGVQLEAQVAPTVRTCEGDLLYGKFSNISYVSQFGIDGGSPIGNPQTTGHEVVSQCLSACAPIESVVFNGERLYTILKFTNTDRCTWSAPSKFTSGKVDAYLIGGGGGGGAAGGGGGGAGYLRAWNSLSITSGESFAIQVGTGGLGADLNSAQGGNGTSTSITPGLNGTESISVRGGGGGGSSNQLGSSSADVVAGGNGINTVASPPTFSFGGSGGGSLGLEGTFKALSKDIAYGDGGDGGDGLNLNGYTAVTQIVSSGGGGGAVCAGIESLNFPGGSSQNGGSGGYCGGNSQPGSRDGNDADANTGGGGGGGASDSDAAITGINGAGGDGAAGVIYIVHSEAPIARYVPSSCVDVSGVCTLWEDTTHNPDLAATITGAPAITSTSDPALNGSVLKNSIPVVQGGPGDVMTAFDSITFPSAITPDSGYTLFTVARYNEKIGGQYRRIFDSAVSNLDGINWLSGFWGEKSGVAFHGNSPDSSYAGNWVTPYENSIHGSNWVLSTDQKNLYRSNGTKRSVDNYAGGVGPGQLVVNQGNRDERSDFQIADVISFDRELSETEYKAVEAYLSDQYGICVSDCSPPTFDTASSLPEGEVGQPYTQTISATSPYGHSLSYAILDPSNFPPGLSFDTDLGIITGVPTSSGGPYSFTIEVTDDVNGQTDSQVFTITVNDAVPPSPEPPVFSTTSPLAEGEVGQPYTQTIVATSPYGHSISYSAGESQELPAGLSLDSTTGELSGMPTTAGTYTFTVEATDTVNGETDRQEFTLNIMAIGCEDYSNASFVPDNFLLDSNGYPIGC
ncbi:MAG: hypothetical protein EBU96_04485, partial [Actinobacteria bacterium]|nr:hypothetical protein [Actinomycetota bacterium]